MRRTLEENWLRLIRLYTFNTPISKGKYRLFQIALRLCKFQHTSLPANSRDGRLFSANLTTGMQEHLFFFGEYEKVLSRITSVLINPGDVCIDVGANFGWYTTLMALHCGNEGDVHAFEPVPASFLELRKNYALSGSPANVFINELALGDREGTITISLFDGEPTGHASIAAKRDSGAAPFECRMTTLDDYLVENGVGDVDFVKVDIEGAEMMFLYGSQRLFKQKEPPIFLMEMALEQTRHFGYLPNDLIDYIGSRGEYEFFSVDEIRGTLRQITEFAVNDIGANVFCIPRHRSRDSLSSLIER